MSNPTGIWFKRATDPLVASFELKMSRARRRLMASEHRIGRSPSSEAIKREKRVRAQRLYDDEAALAAQAYLTAVDLRASKQSSLYGTPPATRKRRGFDARYSDL